MAYTISDLRRDIRSPYAWPGGYPRYFITRDGAALSYASVRDNLRLVLESMRYRTNDGWWVIGNEVNWEDDSLTCDHSGAKIESAYGLETAEG